MSSKPTLIAFDIESTDLHWYRGTLYSLAIAWMDGETVKSAVWKIGDVPRSVRELLADPSVEKVGHRVRFDMKWLRSRGFKIAGRTHCTKIMQHLLNENEPNGLKDLTRKYFGADALTDETEMKTLLAELKFKHVGQLCALDTAQPDAAISNVILRYNREDAVNTLKLYPILRAKLLEFDKTVRRVFKVKRGPASYYLNESLPSEEALLALELGGIDLDVEELRRYGAEIEAQQEKLTARLNALAEKECSDVTAKLWEKEKATKKTEKGRAGVSRPEFNWSSAQHLGMLIYERFGVPARLTAKRRYAASEEVLATIAASTKNVRLAEILKTYAELKKLEKEQSTYVGSADTGLLSHVADGKIYASYHPFVDTGRLASTDPNMQNLPRGSRAKAAFNGGAGNAILYGDYSQVELRIAADESQDPVMLEWFQLNIDPHRQAAASAFSLAEADVTDIYRQAAKKMNFLTIYDGKAGRLHETLTEERVGNFSLDECRDMLAGWWSAHPEYRKYLDRRIEEARRTLMIVASNGRVRQLPDLRYRQWIAGGWGNQRFIGPASVKDELIKRIKAGQAPKPVYEAPDISTQVVRYAAMKAGHAEKQANNFPIQSVGGSITKAALVALHSRGYKIINTVHDSICVSVPANEAVDRLPEFKAILESAYTLSVPLKADVKILNSLSEKDIFVPATASEKKNAA